MAQVVANYSHFANDALTVRTARTTRGHHDWLSLISTPIACLRIVAIGLSSRDNVLVFHLSQSGSFFREGGLLLLARAMGLRVIAHLHGDRFPVFARLQPRRVRWVLSRASHVITLSSEAEDVVREMVPGVPVSRIANFVAIPPTVRSVRENVILFAGEISYRKGVDVLLEAWNSVEGSPNWLLRLAGPVSDPHLLKNLSQGTVLLGSLPHELLLAELEKCQVAVLPSRAEAFPVFLLEAMAAGCAVVASRVGGIPEMISDAGLLVEAGDASGLAKAISQLLSDVDFRRAMSEKARERVAGQYSAQVVRAQLISAWFGIDAALSS